LLFIIFLLRVVSCKEGKTDRAVVCFSLDVTGHILSQSRALFFCPRPYPSGINISRHQNKSFSHSVRPEAVGWQKSPDGLSEYSNLRVAGRHTAQHLWVFGKDSCPPSEAPNGLLEACWKRADTR
jgi:hypothetical protein